MAFKKFPKPVKTDWLFGYSFNSRHPISILGETDKAYLLAWTESFRKGTSKFFDSKSFAAWVPKAIWENPKYFDDAQNIFNAPSWIKIKRQ